VVVAVVALPALWYVGTRLRNGGGGAAEADAARPDEGPTPVAPPSPAADPAAPALPRMHWVLESAGGDPVPAVLVRARGGTPLLLLALEMVPKRGGLAFDGSAVEVEIVAADSLQGFALARTDRAPPPALTAAELAAGGRTLPVGAALRAATPDGSSMPEVHVAARAPDGAFELDRPLTAGTALLASDRDVVLAIGRGHRSAIPVDGVLLWLDHALGRPLGDVQAELRGGDARSLLEDASALLAAESPTAQDARRALDLLGRAFRLARDRSMTDAVTEHERAAHQVLVRALSRDDPAASIAAAREALARFPDHAGIMADLVQLAAFHGDAFEAARVFEALRGTSTDHARTVADVLGDRLANRATAASRASRDAEAVALAERAVALFPARADLHTVLARALAGAGRIGDAANAARLAAELDPNRAGEVANYERLLAEPELTAEIPFDPQTHVIDARVSVAGIDVEFIVDTGATMTTVPTTVADRLGLRSAQNRRVEVQTASGRVTGEVVQLPWLDIGSMRLERVPAVVIDLPDSLAGRGLLGMNALGRTQVQIDTERGRLILRRQKHGGRRR
jgi:clan AA aspartic protease (TIGR02281 family)